MTAAMNRRKSTHSNTPWGGCVEVSNWRKSSRSTHNGQCIEARSASGIIGIRDSTLGNSSLVLQMIPGTRQAFTASLK